MTLCTINNFFQVNQIIYLYACAQKSQFDYFPPLKEFSGESAQYMDNTV